MMMSFPIGGYEPLNGYGIVNIVDFQIGGNVKPPTPPSSKYVQHIGGRQRYNFPLGFATVLLSLFIPS